MRPVLMRPGVRTTARWNAKAGARDALGNCRARWVSMDTLARG